MKNNMSSEDRKGVRETLKRLTEHEFIRKADKANLNKVLKQL